MSGTLRLFVSVPVGPAWTGALARAADALRPPLGAAARWVRPDLYHVTVMFLGNQDPADVAPIEAALARAASEGGPFDLHLGEIGRLGGRERGALVAHVGDPSGGLAAYRRRLDAALGEAGIVFDAQPLRPHVTLARPRGRSGLPAAPPPDLSGVPPLAVDAIHLVRSELLPNGPRYLSLRSVGLGA